MSKAKQLGKLLIIVGIFIPLVLFPFTTLANQIRSAIVYHPGYLKVVVGNISIPYEYIMAFGITLTFVGIGIVALYRDKKH